MKTLIELYDERPLDNVLAVDMFRPETVVYLCPAEVCEDSAARDTIRSYLQARGCDAKTVFLPVSLLDAESVARTLRQVLAQYPDCALDIAGGSDAALFAGGMVSADTSLPVFTYSNKRNTFFDIQGAPFASDLPCPIRLTTAECFLAAGGQMLPGRVNNEVLSKYLPMIDGFFAEYQRRRSQWTRVITYIQRISRQEKGEDGLYTASGPFRVKNQNTQIQAPVSALEAFERLGMIRDLSADENEGVHFTFLDENVCFFLRDIGSVLELYTWKAALDTGIFQDVRLSAVVNWELGAINSKSVTNELDVVAVRGLMPLFISCKTCDIKTESLNELAILRDRFGSGVARAVIVTSAGSVRSVTRRRAFELGIEVIDQQELKTGEAFRDRLSRIAKWPLIS